jgi:vacuolar-type H+-ATPase subunit I/STV1
MADDLIKEQPEKETPKKEDIVPYAKYKEDLDKKDARLAEQAKELERYKLEAELKSQKLSEVEGDTKKVIAEKEKALNDVQKTTKAIKLFGSIEDEKLEKFIKLAELSTSKDKSFDDALNDVFQQFGTKPKTFINSLPKSNFSLDEQKDAITNGLDSVFKKKFR